MHFNHLQTVIDHLIRNTNCPQCQSKYQPSDVFIIGSTPFEGLLHFQCPKCFSNIFIRINLTGELITTPPRQHRSIKKQCQLKPISSNDVLDMTNFLKNLEGDLTPYLKNTQ